MTKEEAIEHYGTQAKLAAALGLKQPTIACWEQIPAMHQLRLERLTKGKLRAELEVWRPGPLNRSKAAA